MAHLIPRRNLLLATDVYKMGHMDQYKPGTNKVYSYLQARNDKNYKQAVFFGLQYYLKEYLTKPITHDDAEEFIDVRTKILGHTSNNIKKQIRSLGNLGYLPLKIKAVPEGMIIDNKNVLLTITNTDPQFYWLVGFVESLLLKLWYPITVATTSLEYKKVIMEHYKKSVDDNLFDVHEFMCHDFGYRGDTSEESAIISGMSHLTCFKGSDTVVAFNSVGKYYGGANPKGPNKGLIMSSVPASEHSVMCSFGREGELDAYKHMLRLYPKGIVSIVSDTYDIYNVLTNFAEILKDDILNREGTVVFRPDSGDPYLVLCGDPSSNDPNVKKGCVRLLDEMFGHTVNQKGYKVLNSKVSLIYGDGMYLERYKKILNELENMGYAANNLCIGIGGLLRYHSRDTMGFAIKATKVRIGDQELSIQKDPITDKGKKSHKGYLKLVKSNISSNYVTIDDVAEDAPSLLETVFENGEILRYTNLDEIRERINYQLKE